MDALTLRTLVDELVARAVKKASVPIIRPGTIVDAAGPQVVVDGDVDPIVARSLIGVVAVGQRVMVMFNRPMGALVFGVID